MKRRWINLIICSSLLGLSPISSARGDSFPFLSDPVNPEAVPGDHIRVVANGSPDEIACEDLQLIVDSTSGEQISYVKFIYYGPGAEGPVEIGTDYSPPYQMTLNTCDLVPGWYQIYAIAYDENDIVIFSIKIPLFIPFVIYMPLLMGSG